MNNKKNEIIDQIIRTSLLVCVLNIEDDDNEEFVRIPKKTILLLNNLLEKFDPELGKFIELEKNKTLEQFSEKKKSFLGKIWG